MRHARGRVFALPKINYYSSDEYQRKIQIETSCYLPSLAINGCSATQFGGKIACPFSIPLSIIASSSENYHRYFFQYHFSPLQRVTKKSLNKILQLILGKLCAKLRKWRSMCATSQRFRFPCVASWVIVTQILPAILEKFSKSAFKYSGVIFLFQDVLF